MPFNIRDNTQKSNFQKAEFLSLTPGMHTVRMLETTDNALLLQTHFIITPTGRFTITCLGNDECPVCNNNRKLFLEHPKDARTVPGYASRSDRYVINVLDKTPVKTCPNCNSEVLKAGTDFPPFCPDCKASLVKEVPHPSGRVKLFSISKTLAAQLNDLEMATTDKDGNPIGFTNFDLMLSVSVMSDKKVVTPIPAVNQNDPVSVKEEELLDKSKGAIKLTADEILDLLKGVSLRDVFSARKSEPAPAGAVAEETTANDDMLKSLEDKLNSLFPEN